MPKVTSRQREKLDANEVVVLAGNYTEENKKPIVPIDPYANINEVSRSASCLTAENHVSLVTARGLITRAVCYHCRCA